MPIQRSYLWDGQLSRSYLRQHGRLLHGAGWRFDYHHSHNCHLCHLHHHHQSCLPTNTDCCNVELNETDNGIIIFAPIIIIVDIIIIIITIIIIVILIVIVIIIIIII